MTMCKLRAQNPVAHQSKLSSTRVSGRRRLALLSFPRQDRTRHAKNVPQGQRAGQSDVKRERERERESGKREGKSYTHGARYSRLQPVGLFAINIYAAAVQHESRSFIEKRNDPRRSRESTPPNKDV